jgi:hypothetical protein
MASDIFLSYSRADQQLANQFVKIASERGLSVWYDQMIEGGDDWRSKIVDAVSSAKALVILFSAHSNGSRQLIKELAIADSFQKLAIPVLIANCQPRGAYLYELASRNWVNLHPDPSTRLVPLIENLLKEIGTGDSGFSSAPARANHEHVTPPTISTQGATVDSRARRVLDAICTGEKWRRELVPVETIRPVRSRADTGRRVLAGNFW